MTESRALMHWPRGFGSKPSFSRARASRSFLARLLPPDLLPACLRHLPAVRPGYQWCGWLRGSCL